VKALPVAAALLHYPVLNRRGEEVATAVTNLDLHDIARTARTFGVERLFVVTPVPEQQRLVERIRRHWREGFGATYNPLRAEALQLIEVTASLEEALARWEAANGTAMLPVLTGAGRKDGMSFARCRELLGERSLLLVFGTGWGLAPRLFTGEWPVLEPISGVANYNHLPVRAAAAIVFDRLFGHGR
jgi:hypothetical protein